MSTKSEIRAVVNLDVYTICTKLNGKHQHTELLDSRYTNDG